MLRDLGIELAPTQLDGLVAEDEEGCVGGGGGAKRGGRGRACCIVGCRVEASGLMQALRDALVNWRDVYKLVVAFQSFQRVADADLEIREAFEVRCPSGASLLRLTQTRSPTRTVQILSGGGLFVDAEILLKCMKHLEAAPEQEREHSKYIATLVKEADVDGAGWCGLVCVGGGRGLGMCPASPPSGC